MAYEGVKSQLGTDSFSACCAAAATAESACCLVRVPAELIKMQMQSKQAWSLSRAVRAVYTEAGLAGFYRGLGVTLCLDVPFALLQFPLYEQLKGLLSQQRRMQIV